MKTWASMNCMLLASAALGTCMAGDLREVNPRSELDESHVLALTNVRLVDGRGGPAIENATLVIQGSRIADVGAFDAIAIPAGAERIDLSGLSIVPGLIDCHFHSVNELGPPRTFLRSGVTTFRDPGHPLRFYQAVQQTHEPMPRVFLCGSHLDAYPPIWPQQAALIDSPATAKAVVDEHVRGGASAIKIYFRLPADLIHAACEAADAHGVPVTAHLELVSAVEAINAGVDGIEHITSFGTSLASESAVEQFVRVVGDEPDMRKSWRYRLWAQLELENNPRVERLLKQIVDASVVVSPTLAVFERRAGDKDVTEAEVIGFQNMLAFTGMCHRAGATIVVGSHTWVPGAEFGWAFQRELELLVECGLSPAEALEAATLSGAQFLRSDDRLGTLAVGKLADLVVVEGNPLEDVTSMRKVKRVMLSGAWVD